MYIVYISLSRFKTKYDLANHQMTHDLNGMLIPCPVEGCDFTTKNPGSMFKHHKQVHKVGFYFMVES